MIVTGIMPDVGVVMPDGDAEALAENEIAIGTSRAKLTGARKSSLNVFILLRCDCLGWEEGWLDTKEYRCHRRCCGVGGLVAVRWVARAKIGGCVPI